MSRHSFDPQVATEVGLNAAVIYQNIVWWCEKNAANGRHFYEGRYWTYNSVKAFADMFPYLSAEQIRRALEKLEDAGFIASGNFNQSAYDRTKWFCDLRQMHLGISPNGVGENTKPIPDDKPVGKPEGKPFGDFDAFWAEVPRKVGKEAARTAYAKALKKADHDTLIEGIMRYAKERQGKEEQYTVHPSRWLNEGRWQDAPRAKTFNEQLEDMFNGYAIRDARDDDSAGAEYLPAPVQGAGPLRPGDGPTAHPNDSGRYQQEVARLLEPKRFGGSLV